MTRVGLLATSYPRYEGDLAGHFIERAAAALPARFELEAAVPHFAGAPRRERRHGIAVRRFRYLFPERFQVAAYGGLSPGNLAAGPLQFLAAGPLFLGLVLAARRLSAACDLVHAHWSHAGLAALIGSTASRPVVVSIWGSDMAIVRNSAWARRSLARAAAVVAVSETMRSELVSLGLPPERVRLIRTAIDRPRPKGSREDLRRELGLPPRRTLLFLGRLSPVKGPDVLLAALGRGLLEELDAQLVLLGEGPLDASLRIAAGAVRTDRVRFVGRVPLGDVAGWLGASDVLVLPSRSEGLPHAVLEALACGLPAVASAVGGVPEIIEPGVTGWLVRPDDPRALEAALREALADDAERARRGAAALAFFDRSRFDWERVAGELSALYDAALGRPSA